MDDFAVFILSHGRADNVKTYSSLRQCGYTGKIYILIDDLDKTAAKYEELYGEEIIKFSKEDAKAYTDTCDCIPQTNTVLFARNACFRVAKQLGIKVFWQLDDDYDSFGWTIDNQGRYATSGYDRNTKSLNDILASYRKFFESCKASAIAICQGGDLFGGKDSSYVHFARQQVFTRKVMNSFMMATDRPVNFIGRMNDDVNTYVERGRRGSLFITIPRLRLWQCETQKQDGGLTDMYKDFGTYMKSFYTVLVAPSCTRLCWMGRTHKRIHHRIAWDNACPKIISEEHRKK